MKNAPRVTNYEKRKRRVRKKISGTGDCPRLTVKRSLRHTAVQIIDDEASKTLAAVSTVGKSRAVSMGDLPKTEQAKRIGLEIAEVCRNRGISRVVFDRNGYRYHGRIEAVAAGAREGGLRF